MGTLTPAQADSRNQSFSGMPHPSLLLCAWESAGAVMLSLPQSARIPPMVARGSVS